jgi:hypothetical protein
MSSHFHTTFYCLGETANAAALIMMISLRATAMTFESIEDVLQVD